jgi:hypothetical protein
MAETKDLHGQQWTSTDDRKAAADIAERRALDEKKRQVTFRQWWQTARPTKLTVLWSFLAGAVLVIVIGFAWGGWVTGGTAQKMADTAAQKAVVAHLAPICVAQFNQDPARDEKLKELQAVSSSQRAKYVTGQSWATMPGETEPDSQVASECAKLLMQITP